MVQGYNTVPHMPESKIVGVDQGRTGEWLYRQAELVLGPVSTQQLAEKLYGGEIDGKTEVSPVGQTAFRKLADVSLFKVHLAKAEAKHRVEAVERAEHVQKVRRRNLRIGGVVGMALVFGAGAAIAARYLAIYNPLKKPSAELALADISVEPPTISIGRYIEDELLEYPVGGASVPTRKPERVAERTPERTEKGTSRSRPSEVPSVPASATASRPSATAEPDGLDTGPSFDRSVINSVIASKKPTLTVCFNEEVARNPSFAAKIPIEFVIGNDGRVNKLWVDHPQYKQGALADCLLRELQKWPFKPYPGEQATVSLSFTINKRG